MVQKLAQPFEFLVSVSRVSVFLMHPNFYTKERGFGRIEWPRRPRPRAPHFVAGLSFSLGIIHIKWSGLQEGDLKPPTAARTRRSLSSWQR